MFQSVKLLIMSFVVRDFTAGWYDAWWCRSTHHYSFVCWLLKYQELKHFYITQEGNNPESNLLDGHDNELRPLFSFFHENVWKHAVIYSSYYLGSEVELFPITGHVKGQVIFTAAGFQEGIHTMVTSCLDYCNAVSL